MSKLVRTKSKGFGKSSNGKKAGRNNYRPPNKDKAKLFHQLYGVYVKISPIVGVAMYLGFASMTEAELLLLPLHVPALAVFLWMWKRNSDKWAYTVTSVVGKSWFLVVMGSAQFFVATFLVVSPPAAYILAFLMLYVFYFTDGKVKTVPPDKYISGAKEVDAAWYFNYHQGYLDRLVNSGQHHPEFINFLGLLLSTTEAVLGFMLFGETRSGKSLAISMMLNVLTYPNKRALLYDYANNYYAKLIAMGIEASRIILLTPFHRDCVEWLLSYDLTNPAITRVFFEQLIQSNDPKDKFFVSGAINIACDVVETLNRTAKEAGKQPVWGIKELCEFCTDGDRLIDLLQTYPDIWRRNKALATGSEQQQAYMGTLENVFMQLKPAAECWYRARLLGRTVSFRDFPTSDKIVLLGRDEQMGGEALCFFNSAVIGFCVNAIIGKPTSDDTKPAETIIIADEFHTLGKLKQARKITTEGGKYGFCAIFATQSYQVIEDLYGKGETAAMLGSITHLAVFQVNDNPTTKYLSEFFGETTVLEASMTDNEQENRHGMIVRRQGLSWSEKTKPLYTTAHFKSQSKIDTKSPSDGLMDVTIRCDGYNYTLSYHWGDILTMLPPKPTAEQERLNTAPQDEELFYPKPLTNQQLIDLGLDHLIDPDDMDDDIPPYGAYEQFKEVDFDILEEEED